MTTTTYIAVAGGYPTIDKDPNATLDYSWDWSDWLDAVSDTLSAATVTSSGVTCAAATMASGVVTSMISGGTLGAMATVVCHVTTAAGRIDDRTITLRIVQR